MLYHTIVVAAASISLAAAAQKLSRQCRTLPGDSDWPSTKDWDALNSTVNGRLIQGVPLAQVCYGPQADSTACATLRANWGLIYPFLSHPVSVVSPYFENNTCTPFVTAGSVNDTSLCQLGNMASYAIDVSDAETAQAGIEFACKNNVRLIIKNTGHDYLGRSSGKGALALWTHNLKDITVIDEYSSKYYTGPAVKIGAGVQFQDLYQVVDASGLRVTGGSCPTVGSAGGWLQGGGHSLLSSAYGLGADNSLEFEVVTTDGRHLTASPTENSDLYWALSGGSGGNYGVVISAVVKAHKDGPVAGSRMVVINTGENYWTFLEEWMKYLLILDKIPGFTTEVLFSQISFTLVVATLPGGNETTMVQAMAPFYETMSKLNITPTVNTTSGYERYLEHFNEYQGGIQYARNLTNGGRLIPRSLVQDSTRLPQLTATLKAMVSEPDISVWLQAYNVTNKVSGVPDGFNAVIPAWRDSLFLINMFISGGVQDDWSKLDGDMTRANQWQDKLRDLTPGGGAYINEGAYNDAHWKEDYFGGTYDRLRAIKAKYDPNFVLYTNPGPGSDEYIEKPDGHLCKL